MLYKLVDNICAHVDGISLADVGPELEEQIREAAPDAIKQLIKENKKQDKKVTQDQAAKTLTITAFAYIKGLSGVARFMVQKVEDRRVHASRRCAVASVLAYLVQPHDIIPDDAPGGYGFLDDVVMLRAGLVEYLDTLPQPEMDADYEGKVVDLLVSLTPQDARAALLQGVSSMSQLVQLISTMDPANAEGMLAQIVANPLQASSTIAGQGFTPRAGQSYSGGSWSNGAYVEGNNVVISGGPSLIEGQLFIPG